MELFDRLEEIQDLTRVLAGDVKRLHVTLGGRSIQDGPSDDEYSARRAYVRAIFALVEAIVEQHKLLLLDLDTHRVITLDQATRSALSEQAPIVRENGTVSTRKQFLPLRRKLRLVYLVAGEAFGKPLAVRYDTQEWQLFDEAVDLRDRITHPKSFADCHIEGDELDIVDGAHKWFRELNKEFVRVAQSHRGEHQW